MQMNAKYLTFYLDGRGDDALDDDDVDLDDLIDKANAGPDDPRTISVRVAEHLAAPLKIDREKREWIAENKDNIAEAGGDSELAYEHYLKGRVDQYAHELENEIVTGMFEDDGDEDEDEDDDDADLDDEEDEDEED